MSAAIVVISQQPNKDRSYLADTLDSPLTLYQRTIPNDIKSTVAANRIREAVIGHGQIVERRLYYDSRKLSEPNTDRENLASAGFYSLA
jgi:hypothetical protein